MAPDDDVFSPPATQHQEERNDREFIRRLANDYLHFKIYGPETRNTIENIREVEEIDRSRHLRSTSMSTGWGSSSDSNNNDLQSPPGSTPATSPRCKETSFRKTSKVLRKVSLELEQSNSSFFENVCDNLHLDSNPHLTFKQVSEEVLDEEALNWGRVVSLFTFGGKLAEWFWNTHQEERIEEVEEWLAESLSSKSSWIEAHGGWEDFAEKFEESEKNQMTWLKPALLMCAGVSLAALFSIKLN